MQTGGAATVHSGGGRPTQTALQSGNRREQRPRIITKASNLRPPLLELICLPSSSSSSPAPTAFSSLLCLLSVITLVKQVLQYGRPRWGPRRSTCGLRWKTFTLKTSTIYSNCLISHLYGFECVRAAAQTGQRERRRDGRKGERKREKMREVCPTPPPTAAPSALGQDKHRVPTSTQEISDERKEQQTVSAVKSC